MLQGCNNIVISWLCRTCWNNLATSLIILTRLLLTACSKLVDNLGQAVRTQLVDGLLVDLLQDVRFLRVWDMFALLVPSCCNKSGTSCYHLVTRLMTVTDLQQVVPTRLIQAVRNKLLRACCHQLVNNLLRADDIRLVGTTCCESVGLVNLVTRW
jgi:hypothetical protein